MPLGVYGYPAPDDASPNVRSVRIPDTIGPFRVKEYAEGFYAITNARDWLQGQLESLMP